MPNNKTAARTYLAFYLDRFRKETAEPYIGQYAEFTDSLEQLCRYTDFLYQTDGSGHYYPMTEDDHARITRAYTDAKEKCDGFIRELGEGAEIPAPVSAIREILRRDMEVLGGVGADGVTSFPSAVEKARGYSVDASEADELPSVSDCMSTRVPLTFRDADGVEHTGFFTSEVRMELEKEYRTIVQNFVNGLKKPEDKELYSRLLEENNLQAILVPLTESVSKGSYFPLDTNPDLSSFYGDKFDSSTLRDAMYEPTASPLTRQLDGFFTRTRHYSEKLGLKDHSPVSSRNNAMSAVANLLGIPTSVAGSSPMTLTLTQDGKKTTVKGTFMEKAKGVDFGALPYFSPILQKKDFRVSPEGLESIASLQVLDFICHNVDRHPGNMAYQMTDDDPPVITGVQGFDNDLSFGTKETELDGKTLWAPTLDQISVIPASLADSLAHVNRDMLRTALRQCHLSEEEIDAVDKRIDRVNERIAKSAEVSESLGKGEVKDGVMRVVKPEEWKDYSFDTLSEWKEERNPNAFAVVKRRFEPREWQEKEIRYQSAAMPDQDPLVGYFDKLNAKKTRPDGTVLDSRMKCAVNLIQAADALTSFGSDNFDKVKKAVLHLQKLTEYRSRLPEKERDSDAFCREYMTALDRIRDTSAKYLVEKGVPKRRVAINRVDAVTRIARFASMQKDLFRQAYDGHTEYVMRRERMEFERKVRELEEQKLHPTVPEAQEEMKPAKAVPSPLARAQQHIRRVAERLPEGSQRRLLCERAMEAQATIYSLAQDGKPLTAERKEEAQKGMAYLVGFDMAFRAGVFDRPSDRIGLRTFNAETLMKCVRENEVFVEDTKQMSAESLKAFVEYNVQRKLHDKILLASKQPPKVEDAEAEKNAPKKQSVTKNKGLHVIPEEDAEEEGIGEVGNAKKKEKPPVKGMSERSGEFLMH